MKRSNRFFRVLLRPFLVFLTMLLIFSCNDDDSPARPESDEEMPEGQEISPEDRLPLISVTTNGNTIIDEPKVDAQMTIVEMGSETYNGNIGIEFRGASSQMFPKKSYGVETRDENNEDLDVALLGYPEEEDWVFYGPYSDKSLVRNKLIYDLAIDIGQYASRSTFVELEIDGADQGVYVFMEKLKRDKGRIDINNLKEDENTGEDLTGGYILKIDKIAGSNVGQGYNDLISFTSTYAPPNANGGQKIHFLYDDPDPEDITTEQKTYISNYVGAFEDALASDQFTDPQLGYATYIDTESFIDFFLLNELSNNVDGYRLSTFMYKDKNEKLKMGPIWDFNLAFGNADYCDGGENDVWAYRFNERCPGDFWQVPFWWERLLQDPQYVTQLKERWFALRASELSEDAILEKVEAYQTTLNKAGALQPNFDTWPILGSYIWPNKFVGQTYDNEVAYLKDWISRRLAWLDNAIVSL